MVLDVRDLTSHSRVQLAQSRRWPRTASGRHSPVTQTSRVTGVELALSAKTSHSCVPGAARRSLDWNPTHTCSTCSRSCPRRARPMLSRNCFPRTSNLC